MNLRLLARESGAGRPSFGIQAHGINAGETPHPTIREMAAADVAEILLIQPEGPYSLWGYSFGARVAFEAAWQLKQSGRQVDHLLLICPGNPKVRTDGADRFGREATYRNPWTSPSCTRSSPAPPAVRRWMPASRPRGTRTAS
ncbi:thioesterase domain-containing protein [Streptomyces camelliae]|uniref:thioesterase domain-containing protein n=1 Tax=Streptomyces camelliae TaxID=3004093 RepID=UPI002FD7EAF1